MATKTSVMDVTFRGEEIVTTVTSSGAAVKRWLRDIRYMYRWVYHKLVVGLDVEWRPSFSKKHNPAALLQLCVGRHCLIFQLIHAKFFPGALKRFLAGSGIRFVGVGVQEDADRLRKDYDLQVVNTVDLRALAADGMRRPDLRYAGLKAVARAVMGADLQKPQNVRVGKWDAKSLSQEQIKYACIDAFVSFEVGRKLLTGDH